MQTKFGTTQTARRTMQTISGTTQMIIRTLQMIRKTLQTTPVTTQMIAETLQMARGTLPTMSENTEMISGTMQMKDFQALMMIFNGGVDAGAKHATFIRGNVMRLAFNNLLDIAFIFSTQLYNSQFSAFGIFGVSLEPSPL